MPYSLRPPGFSRASKIVDLDAGDGERVRAGEARGSGADDRHALSGRRGARIGRLPGVDQRRRWRSAASSPIRTGLPSAASRTQASSHSVSVGQTRAHMPPMMLASKMVFAEPVRIAGGDLADEQRNVDRGRAGLLARRVVAEIAAVGLDARLVVASAADGGRRNWRRGFLRSSRPAATSDSPWGRAAIVMASPKSQTGGRG